MSSSNVETSKLLAAIGALLLFLSFVPVVGIVGLILLLIGMKGLSEYYHDDGIYRHAFKGLIFGIIGVIAVSVMAFSIGGAFTAFSYSFYSLAAVLGAIALFAVAVIVAFIFYVLMAMNFRRAFNALAERSGEGKFKTAGTLLFWGAILTIIFGIGLILVWIAWIFAALAFFSMNLGQARQPSQYAAPPPPPPAPSSAQSGGFCPNCGAPIQPGTTFCPNCGKPLNQPT
ncbi:MAG: DUF996 domain-containing protein [Candidatus Bathyarchaeota archaeon]|nr:DUF996 domain-containing protein [Candidatus Bathyarchaeota archaeon]